MGILSGLVLTGTSTAGTVATEIANVDLSGILQEVVSLLPVVLPTIVAFLGIRKGISFLIGSLRRA